MKFDLTKPDRKKSEILNATFRCIYEQGIAELSMRSIARAANMNQSTLHYYFQSKENLLIEFIKALFDFFIYDMEKRFQKSDPPEKKLEAIFESGEDFAGKQRELFVVFVDCWSLSIRNPAMKKIFSNAYEKHVNVIEDIIEEGVHQGVFNEVNENALAVLVDCFAVGMGIHWHMRKRSFDARKYYSVLTDLLRTLIHKNSAAKCQGRI